MFNKKRSQITVFVLLGIVIIIVFAFLLYTASIVERSKLESKAEQIIEEVKQTQSIRHYLYLCVKQSAEEALNMLGSQGGRIYDSQGGASMQNQTPSLKLNYSGETINISYGILQPSLNPPYNDSSYPNVPWYPNNEKYHEYVNTSNFYYIGKSTLPFLCDKDGPNKYNASKNFTGASCKMRNVWYWGSSNETIQIQLADTTSKLIQECVDVDYFYNESGYNLTMDKPNTTIVFGEYDVGVYADMPMNVVFNRKGFLIRDPKVTKFVSFSANIPVRMKRIYDFVLQTITEDKKNITFDVLKDYKELESYRWLSRTGALIQVEKTNLNPYSHDSIFRVTDHDSVINGRPYIFQLLIKNRIPILGWVHDTDLNDPYDIIVTEQSIIKIEPKGYDPDEDYLVFNYSGWQETYDYNLNWTCCIQLKSGPRTSACLNTTANNGCVTIDNDKKPKNWTGSLPFRASNGVAEFKTSKEDVGIHILNLSVCDPQGFCDWQEIKIAVKDFMIALARGVSYYLDINNSIASIEDPYTLSAKGLGVMEDSSTPGPFMWCDLQEFPDCIVTAQEQLNLPNSVYNIENITEFHFNMTQSSGLVHNINLTIGIGVGAGTDEMEIEVFECLPHRTAEKTAPYPYNNFSGDNYVNVDDPFQTDHTCCAGDPYGLTSEWDIIAKASSFVCYELVEYGNFKDFGYLRLYEVYDLEYSDELNYGEIFTRAETNDSITGANSSGLIFEVGYENKMDNDIFKRDFTRRCEGDRGNICGGEVLDYIDVFNACDDTNNNGPADRRCSGPSFGSGISYSPLSCERYTDKTFEYELEVFETGSADNHLKTCSETTLCSTQTDYNVSTGYYLCSATCDGIGGCTKSFYPDECYNCLSQNSCDGDNISIYGRGVLFGYNYTGCNVDACPAQPFGSWPDPIVADTCIDAVTLVQYECLDQALWNTSDTPYREYGTTDCSTGDSGAKCMELPASSNMYFERDPGTCSAGACRNDTSWDACSGNYACFDNERCTDTGECQSNSQCKAGAYCDINGDCSAEQTLEGGQCTLAKDGQDYCLGSMECRQDFNGINYFCADGNSCANTGGSIVLEGEWRCQDGINRTCNNGIWVFNKFC